MRRHLIVLTLPFLLAACGGGQPASEAPAPATQAPATPAATSPVADADKAPLFGSWAPDPGNCGSPIVITETSFEGAENVCEVTALDGNGDADGSFTASLSCNSQGQASSERLKMTPIFGPAGEGIRFEYLDRGGEPVTVFRCKR